VRYSESLLLSLPPCLLGLFPPIRRPCLLPLLTALLGPLPSRPDNLGHTFLVEPVFFLVRWLVRRFPPPPWVDRDPAWFPRKNASARNFFFLRWVLFPSGCCSRLPFFCAHLTSRSDYRPIFPPLFTGPPGTRLFRLTWPPTSGVKSSLCCSWTPLLQRPGCSPTPSGPFDSLVPDNCILGTLSFSFPSRLRSFLAETPIYCQRTVGFPHPPPTVPPTFNLLVRQCWETLAAPSLFFQKSRAVPFFFLVIGWTPLEVFPAPYGIPCPPFFRSRRFHPLFSKWPSTSGPFSFSPPPPVLEGRSLIFPAKRVRAGFSGPPPPWPFCSSCSS